MASPTNIAQNFQADAPYGAGTVVQIGGKFDVTSATPQSTSMIGIVTDTPGILLNPDLSGTNIVAVAIHGTVKSTVVGAVSKGDQLMVGQSGALQSLASYITDNWSLSIGSIVGIALEDSNAPEAQINVQIGIC
jgi:hypothetical protein